MPIETESFIGSLLDSLISKSTISVVARSKRKKDQKGKKMKKKKLPPQMIIEDEEDEGEDDQSALEIITKHRSDHQTSVPSIDQDFS